MVPRSRDNRHAGALEAFRDRGVPLNLLRITVDVLVDDDRRFVHQADQVLPFLLAQRPFLFAFVVPVTAEHLVDGPEAELRRFRHEDVLVAMQQCSDLKLREQPRPAVIDDDVGHALEKSQNGQVLLLTEIDADTFVGGVAADHRHALQPRDRVAQVGVDFDAAMLAGLIEAPYGQRPLRLRHCLHRRAPEPDVPMGHIVIAVGQYHPVRGPRGGVDGRERYRHVRLASSAETRAHGYHARFERRLTESGYHLAPPLRCCLAFSAFALAGSDDEPVLKHSS